MDLKNIDSRTLESAPGYAPPEFDFSQPPSPLYQPYLSCEKERAIIEEVIYHLIKNQVTFGDVRFGTDYGRSLVTSDNSIIHHAYHKSTGIGVRAMVKGFWGFSASQDLSSISLENTVKRAVALASQAAQYSPREKALDYDKFAREPQHLAEFHTPIKICPILEPLEQLAEPLLSAAEIGLTHKGIKRVNGWISIFAKRRFFASTEGSRILSTHAIVDALQRFYAVTDEGSAYRTQLSPALAGGLEHYYASNFVASAPKLCQEAVAKSKAREPTPGYYDLILDPHNLALTMHESVGHPTELDRVLGYELGFAGGSFVNHKLINRFQYASPVVNFTANNRLAYGGASQGFDDEGVEAQKMSIIENGILKNLGTCRETAHHVGLERSNGCSRSTHWSDVPIVRIPNLFLEPGKDPLSLRDLISDTSRGIILFGRDSFSIDQMRYNFQFGADMAYMIENGKITEPVRDVIYQSITPEFWQACDAICDATEWQMHGVFNCGKGQPVQSSKMMHGASPARFKNIRVGY